MSMKEPKRQRLVTTLDYANADEACDAAFVGGPMRKPAHGRAGATSKRHDRGYLD